MTSVSDHALWPQVCIYVDSFIYSYRMVTGGQSTSPVTYLGPTAADLQRVKAGTIAVFLQLHAFSTTPSSPSHSRYHSTDL